MNVVARQTIRTGHPASDDQVLEQLRAHAASQGCELVVQRIAEGGYQVDVVRPGDAPPPPQNRYAFETAPVYGAPPPPPQYAMQPYVPPPMHDVRMSPFRGGVVIGKGAQPRAMTPSGVCQVCSRNAPTKHVTFHQNIGAIVLRFPRTITGQLCRRCIGTYFWKYTTVSFFLGWWGVISFISTFVTIPMNIFTYLGSLGLPREFPPNPPS